MLNRDRCYLILLSIVGGCLVWLVATRLLNINGYAFFHLLKNMAIVTAVIVGLVIGGDIAIRHKLYKGFNYFVNHLSVARDFERQLIDAGFYIARNESIIEIPQYKLSFFDDLSGGELFIKNSIKFNTKIENASISPALGRYLVADLSMSNDMNWYVLQLEDVSISKKVKFDSAEDFLKYIRQFNKYQIMIDPYTVLDLSSMLICGSTGSGKSYLIYSIIIQLIHATNKCELFMADPKRSSMFVIGMAINGKNIACNMNEIIELLERFVDAMKIRQAEMESVLSEKLDADYRHFKFAPMYFIFEEYASFITMLQNEDKKTRDHVKSMLYSVVLMGRALGVFLIIIMQKSDSSLIDTAIRDNLPIKILLGNAEQTTVTTIYGTSTVLPDRICKRGEGFVTEPFKAPKPRFIQIPELNFDILEACKI